jgi:hypothetical protein
MNMKKTKLILVIIASLLLISTNISARDPIPIIDQMPNKGDIPADEIEEYVWEEGSVKLPDYPDDDDLLEFTVDANDSRFEYYIDAKSLSVGENDEVVRYTLVVHSITGAENVFYEGIRCDSEEYKTYAFGTGDGKLKPFRDPQWRPIQNLQHMKYRKDLLEHYLCTPPFPRTPEEAINVIKHPQWEEYQQTQYDEWFR